MSIFDWIQTLKPQLPTLAPLLLVYLIGVIISLVERDRYGRPAKLTLVSCVSLFLITAAYPFVQHYLQITRLQLDWTRDEFQRALLIAGAFRTLLYVSAFSLLLVAVFAGRMSPVVSAVATDRTPVELSAGLAPQFRRATLLLVLGILSLLVWAWGISGNEFTRLVLLLSGPLGIAAWVIGSNDLAAMRTGRMDRSGESLTRAGQVLGILGTVLFALVIAVAVWATFVDAG